MKDLGTLGGDIGLRHGHQRHRTVVGFSSNSGGVAALFSTPAAAE